MIIPEYHRLCKSCMQVKHNSMFYEKVKNRCAECQIKKIKECKDKTRVKDVMPLKHTFNQYPKYLRDMEEG